LHLFTELQDQCHFATKVLLDRISSGLGIKGANSLHGHHRDDIPSKSSIFFLHYPPVEETGSQGGQNLHTDLGSLTFLYAQQWGLQVLCPDGNEPGPDAKEKLQWKFVAPRPGHAIINVGDTLRFLTGFRLRSALHRALQLDTGDRYAMTYFLRPNDEVELTDSEGKDCTAVDWYLKKNSNYESKNEAQRSEVMLGGMKVDV
jgi:isopenicillin N synthase-like dioxygenase